ETTVTDSTPVSSTTRPRGPSDSPARTTSWTHVRSPSGRSRIARPAARRTDGDDEALQPARLAKPHRNAEPRRHERDARPLHQHREGDDDEDDPVDPLGLVDVIKEREGPEQDRHRALEAAPEHEGPLSRP